MIHCVFYFQVVHCIFGFSLRLCDYLEVWCLVSKCLEIFLFLLLISSLVLLWSENTSSMISVFLFVKAYVLWATMWSILVYVFECLKRICILLLLSEVFYKYELDCFGWLCGWILYRLADFLSSYSISCWETSFEDSNFSCGFV